MSEWLSVCAAISLLFGAVTAAAYLLYSGLVSGITVLTGSPPVKKITFAYKFRQGPYKNSWQLFKESHSIGPKLPCIGVFYDDPKKVRHFVEVSHENGCSLRRYFSEYNYKKRGFLRAVGCAIDH